jgi:nitrate reductase cytochrome c-type subunit
MVLFLNVHANMCLICKFKGIFREGGRRQISNFSYVKADTNACSSTKSYNNEESQISVELWIT